MIPKGWIATRLSKIADVTSGGTPSRAKAEYWCGHIPWVTTSEIHNGLITDTVEKITENGLVNSSAKLFPVGTILMAMYGQGATRGKVARLGIEASTNQACAAILPKPSVCGEYLFQNMLSRYEEIRNLANDGSQKNLSGGLIKKIPILQPPLAEQRRIAEILSTWDRAIATTEKLIANSEAQKKALMQRLLTGKKRVPGFSGAWEHHAFGRFAHTVRNKVDPRSLRDDVPGIELEHIEAESGRLLGTCQANAQVSLKTPFTRKNVLYGKLRPYLRKFFKPDFDGVCSTEIWALAAKPDLCTPEFLHLLVQSPTFAGAVDVSSGSKMPRADWGIVAVTIFAIPSVKEQTAIAGILRDADRAIEVHESQLTALRQEKSALMQQLLTGKRRVKLPEKVHA